MPFAQPFVVPNNSDTASINAAIQSLGSGGGVVWCPPAIYARNDPTIIVPSHVTLRGCGEATAIVATTSTNLPMIQIAQGAVGANVEDFHLDMGSFYASAGMAVETRQTRRCKISGLMIRNIGHYGIVCNGDAQMEISDNYFERAVPAGNVHNQSIAITDSLGMPYSLRISRNRSQNTGMLLTLSDSIVDDNYGNRSGYGSNLAFGDRCSRNLVSRNTMTNGVGIDEGGFAVSGIENWGTWTLFADNVTNYNDGVGVTHGGYACHIEGHEAIGNGAILPAGQGTGISFVDSAATNSTSAETYVNGVRTANPNGHQVLPKHEFASVVGLIRYGNNDWR